MIQNFLEGLICVWLTATSKIQNFLNGAMSNLQAQKMKRLNSNDIYLFIYACMHVHNSLKLTSYIIIVILYLKHS